MKFVMFHTLFAGITCGILAAAVVLSAQRAHLKLESSTGGRQGGDNAVDGTGHMYIAGVTTSGSFHSTVSSRIPSQFIPRAAVPDVPE